MAGLGRLSSGGARSSPEELYRATISGKLFGAAFVAIIGIVQGRDLGRVPMGFSIPGYGEIDNFDIFFTGVVLISLWTFINIARGTEPFMRG